MQDFAVRVDQKWMLEIRFTPSSNHKKSIENEKETEKATTKHKVFN